MTCLGADQDPASAKMCSASGHPDAQPFGYAEVDSPGSNWSRRRLTPVVGDIVWSHTANGKETIAPTPVRINRFWVRRIEARMRKMHQTAVRYQCPDASF